MRQFLQAASPVHEFAVSENYKLLVTQQGELYLQALKDHVILTSEMAFSIRGKMKGGEAAETLKRNSDNWVAITLEPTSLITVEAKMAPGQPGLDRLNLTGSPITLETFLSRLESVGIVRTKIEAHECVKEGGQRRITSKTTMAIEVPVNEGKGKPSIKTIASYIDMAALRQSEHLNIVTSVQYVGAQNTCKLGYPHVFFNKAIRLQNDGKLIQLAARCG